MRGIAGEQHAAGADRARQQPPAQHDFVGVFAQQGVVAGDPGFALGAVEDQQFAPDRQFLRRREAGAAQSDDAGGADAFAQRRRVGRQPVQRRQEEGVLAFDRQQDLDGRQPRKPGQLAGRDRLDAAGARCMHIGAEFTVGLAQHLAAPHPVADGDAGPGRAPGVLAQRHAQHRRRRAGPQPVGRRFGLVAGQAQAAVEAGRAHGRARRLSDP